MDLTIFTPTYNRGYILGQLYQSLCKQKNKNFIWLIVDDGSIDNTKDIVLNWIDDGLITIKYIFQENQGKHIAHNTGVMNCITNFFLCVDSDDYLLDDSIDSIYNDLENTKYDWCCGVLTSRIIGGVYMDFKKETYSSLSNLYEKGKYKGETSLVFKIEVLKEYLFKSFNDEKFLGEEYIYCQIDKYYKFYISREKYCVCEYLEDGYTYNVRKLIKNNSFGYTMLKLMKLKNSSNFVISYKAAILYVAGCFMSKKKIFYKSCKKPIILLALPVGYVVFLMRYKKIN